jgi:hypothetical protein
VPRPSKPLQPILIDGKKFMPIAQAAEYVGLSVQSITAYASLGIVQQRHRGGFRYISEVSITNLKAKPTPAWVNAEWHSKDGRKYYPVTKAAAIVGVNQSTMWHWAKGNKTPFNFALDIVMIGVTKKRPFIAEDSLLALAHVMKAVKPNVVRVAKATSRNSSKAPTPTRRKASGRSAKL